MVHYRCRHGTLVEVVNRLFRLPRRLWSVPNIHTSVAIVSGGTLISKYDFYDLIKKRCILTTS